MKIHQLLPALCFLALGVSCKAQPGATQSGKPRGDESIHLTAARTDILWAEGTSFNAEWSYNPGPPWVAYYDPPVMDKTFIACTRQDGRTVLVYQRTGAPPPTINRSAFPYEGKMNRIPANPLDIGSWKCHLSVTVNIEDDKSRKVAKPFISNEVAIQVKKPGANDEALIRDSGLWELYEKQNGFVGKNGMVNALLTSQQGTDTLLTQHPESSYYCRYMATRYSAGMSKEQLIDHAVQLLTPHKEWSSVVIHTDSTLPQAWQDSFVNYDNLLKFNCPDITSEEVWLLKTMEVLNGGYFEVGKKYAQEGRKVAKDPRYIEWFDRILSFKSSTEFLAAATTASAAKSK